MEPALLAIEGMSVEFGTHAGAQVVVDGLDLVVRPGQCLALVGESGCGKSVSAAAVLDLLPEGGRVRAGRILWKGMDLLAASPAAMRRVRGGQIAMVFQDATAALDPLFTVADQIVEVLQVHRGLRGKEARSVALDLLLEVGLEDAAQRLDAYPHQLSGGMCQRVALAIALAGQPELLIADEPTTALDVSLQARVLAVLRRIREERGIGILLVTHDLGVVTTIADEVAVMYAGKLVESGRREAVLTQAQHPYTRGLLASLPRLEGDKLPLIPIPGQVPEASKRPEGCAFHPRCSVASEQCRREEPSLRPTETAPGHRFACHHPEGPAA